MGDKAGHMSCAMCQQDISLAVWDTPLWLSAHVISISFDKVASTGSSDLLKSDIRESACKEMLAALDTVLAVPPAVFGAGDKEGLSDDRVR